MVEGFPVLFVCRLNNQEGLTSQVVDFPTMKDADDAINAINTTASTSGLITMAIRLYQDDA